jgi:hypothetical protein
MNLYIVIHACISGSVYAYLPFTAQIKKCGGFAHPIAGVTCIDIHGEVMYMETDAESHRAGDGGPDYVINSENIADFSTFLTSKPRGANEDWKHVDHPSWASLPKPDKFLPAIGGAGYGGVCAMCLLYSYVKATTKAPLVPDVEPPVLHLLVGPPRSYYPPYRAHCESVHHKKTGIFSFFSDAGHSGRAASDLYAEHVQKSPTVVCPILPHHQAAKLIRVWCQDLIIIVNLPSLPLTFCIIS